MNFEQAKHAIHSFYDKFAGSGMDSAAGAQAAQAFCRKRYGEDRLSTVPQSALALACGCGNPVADIGPGFSVVDLGCGGGLDVILAARAAEEQGRVVGVDLSPEMIEAARRAAGESDLSARIHFRVADMENMALLPRVFANVVTTNCVIGFCTDKLAVYRNIFRVLRPGGILVACEVMAAEDDEADIPAAGDALFEISSPKEHLAILRRFSFDVLGVEHTPLAAEDLEVIAAYPGMDGVLLAARRVEVVTIIAKRRPLN